MLRPAYRPARPHTPSDLGKASGVATGLEDNADTSARPVGGQRGQRLDDQGDGHGHRRTTAPIAAPSTPEAMPPVPKPVMEIAIRRNPKRAVLTDQAGGTAMSPHERLRASGQGRPWLSLDDRPIPHVTVTERPCPRRGTHIVETPLRRPGRPRTWCSPACRRAASEERRAATHGAIATRFTTGETTLADHIAAVLASPAACRRVLRRLQELEKAGSLNDSKWSSVADELTRLRRASQRSRRG